MPGTSERKRLFVCLPANIIWVSPSGLQKFIDRYLLNHPSDLMVVISDGSGGWEIPINPQGTLNCLESCHHYYYTIIITTATVTDTIDILGIHSFC